MPSALFFVAYYHHVQNLLKILHSLSNCTDLTCNGAPILVICICIPHFQALNLVDDITAIGAKGRTYS